MATDKQMVDALEKAAEALLGRALRPGERNDLVKRFNEAKGTDRDRADEALRKFTNLTEAEIGRRKAASDNTDRIIQDLKDTLDDWKAGT